MARLEKQTHWLEREYPDAAAILRKGPAEMLTVSRLGLSPSLCSCLCSTNIIESPSSGVRLRARSICRWRDGKVVLRWAAAAFLMTEKHFRRILGYRDLWMLKAAWRERLPRRSPFGRWRKMIPDAAHVQRNSGHSRAGHEVPALTHHVFYPRRQLVDRSASRHQRGSLCRLGGPDRSSPMDARPYLPGNEFDSAPSWTGHRVPPAALLCGRGFRRTGPEFNRPRARPFATPRWCPRICCGFVLFSIGA